MTTFDNTIKALAEWEKGEPARRAAWNKVETTLDLACCEADDRDALRKVQEAFCEDTKHINRLDNCLLLNIDDIRKAVKA